MESVAKRGKLGGPGSSIWLLGSSKMAPTDLSGTWRMGPGSDGQRPPGGIVHCHSPILPPKIEHSQVHLPFTPPTSPGFSKLVRSPLPPRLGRRRQNRWSGFRAEVRGTQEALHEASLPAQAPCLARKNGENPSAVRVRRRSAFFGPDLGTKSRRNTAYGRGPISSKGWDCNTITCFKFYG